MRRLFTILFLLPFLAFGQQHYHYSDSTKIYINDGTLTAKQFIAPTAPWINDSTKRYYSPSGSFYIDTSTGKIYYYTLASGWLVTTGSDTGGLHFEIQQRVKYADTAHMLSPYLQAWMAALLYQPLLGFTPENVANKATGFGTLNNNLYPTTAAVSSYIASFGYTTNTGTVTSITAGTGLSGGAITTSGTISLPNTGTAGTHGSGAIIPVITTDAQGRATAISDAANTPPWGNITGTPPLVNSINGNSGALVWSTAANYGITDIYTKTASDARYASISVNGTVTSIVAGTGLSGGTITTTGTISMPNTGTAGTYGSATQTPVLTTDAQGRITGVTNTTITGTTPGGAAGGDLTGTYPNPTLITSGVSAGSFGSATQVPSITVDANGRVTAAANTTISGVAPGGAAGGDLTSTYPNPIISPTFGRIVSIQTPTFSLTGTTSESNLVTVTIPANTISAGHVLQIYVEWSFTGTAGTKTVITRLDNSAAGITGTVYVNVANVAGNVSYKSSNIIRCPTTSSQTASGAVALGGSNVADISSAFAVSSPMYLKIDGLMSNSGDAMKVSLIWVSYY